MKKLILFMMFIYGCCDLLAQDCDLCGTWIGASRVFTDGDNTTKMTYIIIKKYGENYSVRVKEVYTYDDQSTKTYYWHDCFNIYVNGKTIGWRSFSHQIDDNEDGHWKHDGKIIDVAKYFNVCTATLDNGILHFSQKVECEYYGRNGEIIGEHHQQPFPIKDLFKDDDDW